MRLLIKTLILLSPLPCLLSAQSWEVGASGGYGFIKKLDVSNGSVTGKTGFESGFAAGALLGNDMHRYVGGEVRYTYRKEDLMVSSGSTKVTASGQSHALHYDALVHAAKTGSKVRPFLAAGAGVKLYRGTGAEPSFQPLSNLVVLTHTSEWQPLISLGGGVKMAISKRTLFRIDVRDYTTPLPDNLLASPNTTKLSGWIHDFVFLVGISGVF